MVVIGLNLVLIAAGLSQIDVLPAYMKNFAGVNEFGISLVFAANTILIVLAQLPVARVTARPAADAHARGGRRLLGGCWLFVPVVGLSSAHVATAGFMVLAAILGVGECLHGAVQAPLVTDLADERLMGRYMAASAFSWSAGLGDRAGHRRLHAGGIRDCAVGWGGTRVLRRRCIHGATRAPDSRSRATHAERRQRR